MTGTVGKGLEVLRALGAFPHGATAAEVVQVVRLPFSTAYRLLAALVDTGFADFDAASRRYRVGLPVFELAATVAHARGIGGSAIPVLREVTAATGESVLLLARAGDELVTLHKLDGPQYRTTTDPGDRTPLHSTAAGKALLAALPVDEREALVARLDLEPRTPSTIVERPRLLAQLERAAELGWASQSEEHDLGMRAIAVALPQAEHAPTLVLALAAPVFRVDQPALEAHVPTLRDAARRLGIMLPAT